jgi:hypothetical protein
MHLFIKNNYLFLKYFKIVFFNNKKICERYGTIWNDMELKRSGTFVNVRRTFRQGSYERPYLYTIFCDIYYVCLRQIMGKSSLNFSVIIVVKIRKLAH